MQSAENFSALVTVRDDEYVVGKNNVREIVKYEFYNHYFIKFSNGPAIRIPSHAVLLVRELAK